MATKTPLYLDFENGEVKELASGDSISAEALGSGTPDSSNFLRGDGTWATPGGTGDVVGPAGAVNNRIVLFDGTTGKLIKDGGALLTDKANTVHTHTISDVTGLQASLDNKVDENAPITGATKTKITYDAKGLITAGADATTADIADSTNKRYVTDADLTDIGNLSGINTGDQTSIVGISGTKAQFDTACSDGNFVYTGDPPTAHNHPQSDITNLVADLAAKQPLDTQLTDLSGLSYAGNSLKVVRVNSGETGFELAAASGSSDIALSLLAPLVDETILSGYSALVNRKYTVASGKKLTIGSGSIFRIH